LAAVKTEVIEVDMAPVAGVSIDESDVDIAADLPRQIDGDAVHVLHAFVRCDLHAGDAGERDVVVLEDDLDAGRLVKSAADEETRPRVSHLERDRRESALRAIAFAAFVGADPIAALVLALHAGAARSDGVAVDRLADERISRGRPVPQRSRLEV